MLYALFCLILVLSLFVAWLLNRESTQPTTFPGQLDHPTSEREPQAVDPTTHAATIDAPTPLVPTAPTEEPTTSALETPVPATPSVDDLTIIEGIGPKINNVLHDAGIRTFADLAQADVGALRQILLDAGLRINNPATWPQQAALAAAGQSDELKALQTRLSAGRRAERA